VPVRRRVRSSILTVTFVLLTALIAGLAPGAEAAPAKPKAPTRLHLATNGYGKFEVAWKAPKKATRYRVTAATDKAMKHVVYRSAYGTARTRWVYGAKIKEGAKYYVRVQAYNSTGAGGKSKVLPVRPKVYPAKKPENLTARPVSSTSLALSWRKARYATAYTVKFMRTATAAPSWTKVLPSSARSLTVTGIDLRRLGLPRSFFVKVTADRKKKTFRDSETLPVGLPFPTPASAHTLTPVTMSVGSYNVLLYTAKTPGFSSWSSRANALAAQIRSMNVDVLGVQEATWAVVNGARPVQQLARASGMTLAQAPNSPTPCSVHSVHILYDSSVFRLTECGSTQLDARRMYTWAVLKSTATGGSVFVVNTHLATVAAGEPDALQIPEAKAIATGIRAHNTHGYPVVLTGDLNSFYGKAATTPMGILVGAPVVGGEGLVGADLVARTLSNAKWATTHKYKPTKPNGVHIDHILTSDAVVVKSFKVDAAAGREHSAPSDHWPVQATLLAYPS